MEWNKNANKNDDTGTLPEHRLGAHELLGGEKNYYIKNEHQTINVLSSRKFEAPTLCNRTIAVSAGCLSISETRRREAEGADDGEKQLELDK